MVLKFSIRLLPAGRQRSPPFWSVGLLPRVTNERAGKHKMLGMAAQVRDALDGRGPCAQ
jgi:hypothetical protein